MKTLNFFEKVVIFGGTGSTLIINPWFQLDPINIPKMVLVVTTAAFLTPWVIISMKDLNKIEQLIISSSFLFLLTSIFAIIKSDALLTQQIWGTWGRSTGITTYIAFIIIFLACLFMSNVSFRTKSRLYFERLGYVVTGYAVAQWAKLDPINWSQDALVSTLGNINFMSSLVGLASISYASRVFFEPCKIHTKVFYFCIIIMNLLLIVSSNSIQGIAIFLAGAVLSGSFHLRSRKSFGVSVLFFLSSSIVGLLGLLGTASIGPLKFLRQETVIFRIDYWKAAVRMIIDKPWSGVGFDSYGDFYRFYRDEAAIMRTGPQRVTNTAHNIFLDIGSGAGVFTLLSFIILFLAALYVILRALSTNSFDKDSIFWSALFIGFIVFCLISINQIGVGVWGFIAMGLVIGTTRTPARTREESKAAGLVPLNKPKSKFVNNKFNNYSRLPTIRNRRQALLNAEAVLVALIAFIFAGQQASIDSSLYRAIRDQDFDTAYKISFSSSAQDQHREIIIMKLVEVGRQEDALRLAQRATKLSDRNWDGWVHIVSSNASSENDKKRAALKLLELDPNNGLVREELLSLLP